MTTLLVTICLVTLLSAAMALPRKAEVKAARRAR